MRIFDLTKGEEEKQKVLENVMANISFRGANLWILACAIVIASVGLNVNSNAVIIGAMLISPLMGPIVGAGFSLGVFDFMMLRKSLKNLLNATLVGLTVSAIYFFVSPFKETQSELLARTSPNIYDIMIAFFGGLVGVIAITRVEKGNPIPGVAIATALMPPLCTAGYGLAIGNFRFFFGALYLYTINCVFICIATFLIVKYLKYPFKKIVDQRRSRLVKQIMTILIVILVLPSIYFAYNLFQERRFDERINTFIENSLISKGYTIIYKKTRYAAPRYIELAFLNKKFAPEEISELNKEMKTIGLERTKLIIRQDTIDLKKDILNEINSEKIRLSEKDRIIQNLQNEINKNRYDNVGLLAEIKILFPKIREVSISNHPFNVGGKTQFVPVAIYRSSEILPAAESEKISQWLQQRLDRKQVLIFKVDTIK